MEGAETVAERQIIIYVMLNLSKNYRKSFLHYLSTCSVLSTRVNLLLIWRREIPIQDVSLEVNSVTQRKTKMAAPTADLHEELVCKYWSKTSFFSLQTSVSS